MPINVHNMTLPERVVEYVACTGAALDKAAAAMDIQKRQQQKIAELIPKAVDALVSGERIEESQREKAAEALRDPVRTLELLIKVAVHRNVSEQRLGQPVDQRQPYKAASHDPSRSLHGPFAGRRTTQVKQSDVNLFTRLGLDLPSNED